MLVLICDVHVLLTLLAGLTTLEKLNVGWCIGVRNSDIKHLAGTKSSSIFLVPISCSQFSEFCQLLCPFWALLPSVHSVFVEERQGLWIWRSSKFPGAKWAILVLQLWLVSVYALLLRFPSGIKRTRVYEGPFIRSHEVLESGFCHALAATVGLFLAFWETLKLPMYVSLYHAGCLCNLRSTLLVLGDW